MDRKLQVALYAVVLLLAYCEEQQIPVMPLLWAALSRFWYGIAEFAGRQGLKVESRYWETVKANG